MQQITCKNLSIGYDGQRILSDISFEINAKDYVCVVGENGAGKSTLVKTILGLIAKIDGEIIMGDELKSTDIGYMPQQTQIQKDFPASVQEVVLSGCLNKQGFRPFYNKAEKQLAKSSMEKLGIENLKKKSYCNLSGGQQQRVLLARALCATGKILLLDEPTAGLDVNSSEEMYNIIKALNDEGITIIMITHNLDKAIQYANFVLSVSDKKVSLMEKQAYLSWERGQNGAVN